MGFNFFKNKEVPSDEKLAGPVDSEAIKQKVELNATEKDILMQAGNENEALTNKLSVVLEADGEDVIGEDEKYGDKKEKKDKTLLRKIGKNFTIACVVGTIGFSAIGCGHADRRAFIDLAQARILGGEIYTLDDTNKLRKDAVSGQRKYNRQVYRAQQERLMDHNKAKRVSFNVKMKEINNNPNLSFEEREAAIDRAYMGMD